jgi:predicted nucleic acid-binding Zn ribbon protein
MSGCVVCKKPLRGKQRRFCSTTCKGKFTNNVFQNYQTQRTRGKTRKLELIRLKGGQCEVCGYHKNTAALCFHHRDPKQKRFSLDLRDLSNRIWEALLEEVEKCALLCCNCHAEAHHPTDTGCT